MVVILPLHENSELRIFTFPSSLILWPYVVQKQQFLCFAVFTFKVFGGLRLFPFLMRINIHVYRDAAWT
jgi:hypothetical protein